MAKLVALSRSHSSILSCNFRTGLFTQKCANTNATYRLLTCYGNHGFIRYDTNCGRSLSKGGIQGDVLLGLARSSASHRSLSTGSTQSSASSTSTEAQSKHLDFQDTKTIYSSRKFSELFKSYFVFSMCSVKFIVRNPLSFLSLARKLLGRSLFRRLMKATVYGQFMAGETKAEVAGAARKNADNGIFTMIAYTAGEVHGVSKDVADMFSEESLFKKNKEKVLESLDIGAECKAFSPMTPIMPTKMTFFTHPDVLVKCNEVLTAQQKFIEGSLSESNSSKREDIMGFFEEVLADAAKEFGPTKLPSKLDRQQVPTTSLTTSLWFALTLNAKLSQSPLPDRVSSIPVLSADDRKRILSIWKTVDDLGQRSRDNGVYMCWDAEQTYLQTAIDCFTLEGMRKFNGERAVIHNTYQCYLTSAHDKVVREFELAERENFNLGLKVVRGAYLDEERRRSSELGYPDPVNPTYDATTEMYHRVVEQILDMIIAEQNGARSGNLHVTFATHNEGTIKHVIDRCDARSLPLNTKRIGFAQLHGMRDHLSLALGHGGLTTGTVVHYGDVEEAVVWLCRRMIENKSGVLAAAVERRHTRREMIRRLLP